MYSLIALIAVLIAPLTASASSLFPADALGEYLLVGTGDGRSVGTSTAVSNYELGANHAPVPMSGLSLDKPIPPNTLPVAQGIGGKGNVAITHQRGKFDLSNVDIYGTVGVQCAGSAGSCNDGASNTTFNGASFPSNGLSGDVDFTDLKSEISAAKATIPGLVGDQNILLDLSSDGKFSPNTVFNLAPGLTMIDIDTGGNDLLLEKTNLVFDGSSDSYAIVRVPDDANFKVTESAILVGDSGIGLNNVLFYTDKPDTDGHFDFSNLLVNGVAFWDLSMQGGELVWNNVQGCTQAVGDKINANDVRLTNCAFHGPGGGDPDPVPTPEPSAVAAFAVGTLLVGGAVRRRARHP